MEEWEPNIIIDENDFCKECATKDARIAHLEADIISYKESLILADRRIDTADAELKRLRAAVEWALKVIEETASMLTDKKQVYHDSKAAWIMLANELRRRAGL